MSIEREDLDAAVAANVLPQAQADAFLAFVAQRQKSRLAQFGHEDERFRFMRGFNDFFFAIGILLFSIGIGFFAGPSPIPSMAAAAIMWALSELLVRRMRLVLPGILLSIFFAIFVYRAVPFDLLPWTPPARGQATGPFWSNFILMVVGVGGTPVTLAVKALIAGGAGALYYWRFRLPFALLVIASSLVIAVLTVAPVVIGSPSMFVQSLIILVCGLAVFVIAMAFDMSDRERVTRRADCAFWLHLLAAPLLVHSLIALIASNTQSATNMDSVATLVIVALLAVVAIAIDRRALLVSALVYVGIVISYAIAGTNFWTIRDGQSQAAVFFATMLILGTGVIALGVGWLPLRKWLIKCISPSLAGKLPPLPRNI